MDYIAESNKAFMEWANRYRDAVMAGKSYADASEEAGADWFVFNASDHRAVMEILEGKAEVL